MKTQRDRRILGTTAVPNASAFTRLELTAVLVALAVLAALALPVLANNRERSQRVVCVNNLRLAGQGLQEWATEHGGQLQWRTSWTEGGTMVVSAPYPPWQGLQNNVWFQWAWLSNDLRSPRILVCPSDTNKVQASDWTSYNPGGGFAHANFRDKSVSYLIGLDVLQEHTDGLVAGDRNVIFNGSLTAGCSSGVTPARTILPRSPNAGVGSGLHEGAGNFLFKDGRVEELSSQAFARKMALLYGNSDNSSVHFQTPN